MSKLMNELIGLREGNGTPATAAPVQLPHTATSQNTTPYYSPHENDIKIHRRFHVDGFLVSESKSIL
jgi:hypothetical protein